MRPLRQDAWLATASAAVFVEMTVVYYAVLLSPGSGQLPQGAWELLAWYGTALGALTAAALAAALAGGGVRHDRQGPARVVSLLTSVALFAVWSGLAGSI